MFIQPQKLSENERSTLVDFLTLWVESLPISPATDLMKINLTKKLRPLVRPPELAERAKALFLKTEEDCLLTNRRIRSTWSGHTDYSSGSVLYLAQRKIRSILGDFSVQEMVSLGRFGPGSTFSCCGADVSRTRKFSLTDVTFEFQQQAAILIAREYPLWCENLTDSRFCVPILSPVPGGRYSTVLKDQSIDRSIIVEPTINSWFQQGIGRLIRKRLYKSTGVNLDDQSVNQRLAKLGSITDDLATIDFSSASDLISNNLVKDLLPPDWYYWLNLTRSHRVLIDDRWVELEKFSSMGNGFTFDLESLIFYALAWAVTVYHGYNPFWVNVFGDDLVTPSAVKEPLLECFSDVGLQINVKKSFFEGPFRESCGHDYFKGENIRSVYLKGLQTDIDVMKVHNRIIEWGKRVSVETAIITSFLRLWKNQFHPIVPQSLGDAGWHGSFDEATPPLFPTWELYKVKALVPVLKRNEVFCRDLLLDRLLGSEFQNNFIVPRLDPIGYRLVIIPSKWDDPSAGQIF